MWEKHPDVLRQVQQDRGLFSTDVQRSANLCWHKGFSKTQALFLLVFSSCCSSCMIASTINGGPQSSASYSCSEAGYAETFTLPHMNISLDYYRGKLISPPFLWISLTQKGMPINGEMWQICQSIVNTECRDLGCCDICKNIKYRNLW